MSYLSRRSSPYPFHVKIAGVGLMLGQAKPNAPLLVSTKTQDISAIQPPDFSYAGISPLGDRAEPYQSLVLGMGLKTQEKWEDMRYFDAIGVDLSVWPWCKGPQVNTVAAGSPASDVAFFFELGGVLYRAQGTLLYRKAAGADTWSLAFTFAAAVINVSVFTSNFDGVQRAWVALVSGVARYSTDGTTWTGMATFSALAFAVIGREFWWAEDTNRLRKLDTNADPTNEANYTTAFYRVGDKSSAIVNLMVTASGVLVIAKTDGLYTLDRAGDDHMLYPFLHFAIDPGNAGRAYGQFENDLYVAYGTTLVKVGPDFSATEVGPETLVNYDGAVRGKITAFGGVGMHYALATIANPDTGNSYLLKYGTFAPTETDAKLVQAWHGSLTAAFAGTIRGLFVSSIGAPAGHTRTYLAYSNGTIGWLVNPCVPNPAACSQYRFHVGDSWVTLPIWHGTFHVSTKSLRSFVVAGPGLDLNNYVTLDYNLGPPGTPWTSMPEHFDRLEYEEVSLPTDTAAVLAAFRVHLWNTANTASPQVSAVSIEHALRPHRIMTVQLEILCSDGLVRRDGVPLRIGRKEIQRVVEAAVDTPGAVRCVLPDETVQELSFTDYSVSQAFDEVGRQWRGSLQVKATQWQKAS